MDFETLLPRRLTPFSLNTAAKIEYLVMCQPHWFDRLRTAENIIEEKTDALKHAEISKNEKDQKILYQEVHLNEYSDLEQIEITADIARWALESRRQAQLVAEAQIELDIAKALKQKIIDSQPEIAGFTDMQMQSASYQAYVANKSNLIAVTCSALKHNLPSELIGFLLNGTDDCIRSVAQEVQTKLCQIEARLDTIRSQPSTIDNFIVVGDESKKLEHLLRHSA